MNEGVELIVRGESVTAWTRNGEPFGCIEPWSGAASV
jgi:hypothetical protein